MIVFTLTLLLPSSSEVSISGEPAQKHVVIAYAWSIGLTTCLSAMIYADQLPGDRTIPLGGMIYGPSAGQFYAHNWALGTLFPVVRISALMLYYGGIRSRSTFQEKCALTLFIGATLADLALLPVSVRNHNKKQRLNIEPIMDIHNGRCGIGFNYQL